MLRGKIRQSGLQGASLIAITYIYFLIFAQFAFLKRLANLGIADAHLKTVMAAMAIGGILFSLLTPRLILWPSAAHRLRAAFVASGAAAFLSLLPLTLAAGMGVAFLIGGGLGLLTVTLVTHLRLWTGNRNPLLMVGLGTGFGYLVCNVPALFVASARTQASVAGLLCLGGICVTLLPQPVQLGETKTSPRRSIAFSAVLASFTALVWLDSAAFFIIQNNSTLKAGAWQGSSHLWANGLLHLAAALVSASLLRTRNLVSVLAAAFLALGCACLLLLHPDRALLASAFYPVGVSLYSVALVAYPSLLAPASSATSRARLAGWIYAVAGWGGSAMGIGMAQRLGHVPVGFVIGAGAVVLTPWLFTAVRRYAREFALTGMVAIAAFCSDRLLLSHPAPTQLPQVERGRQVYISEGCINCHSQYVRPHTADVLMWGPVESLQMLRLEKPPLIGNRRQGPDLAEVGGRRSALWLKAHFYNPAAVSGASIMPSFGFLFRDERGDDLVAYLESLHSTGTLEHQNAEKSWRISDAAAAQANAEAGAQLVHRYCATCHSSDGPTRQTWQARFKQLPVDLTTGPFRYIQPSDPPATRLMCLAQIVRFGIPATDMPGHEYLSDIDIASICLWVSQNIRQPLHTTNTR